MSWARNILPVPVLWPLDSFGQFLPIRFQFIPGSFTRDIGSDYTEVTSLNREHPVLQFTKGQMETFSFEAKLFSQSAVQEVNTLLALLIRATRRDETLKRPPVWMFVWGSAVQEQVVIKKLGGIKYGPLRPDGLLREVTLTIELARYVAFDVKLSNITNAPETLLRRVTKSTSFWEGIGLATYGQALLGTVLSYQQGSSVPVPGKTVVLPSKASMLRSQLQPQSPPLKRTLAGINAQSNIFKLRNARVKVSSVITKGSGG